MTPSNVLPDHLFDDWSALSLIKFDQSQPLAAPTHSSIPWAWIAASLLLGFGIAAIIYYQPLPKSEEDAQG